MRSKSYIKSLLKKFSAEGNKIAFYTYDGEKIKEISYRLFLDDILKVSGYFFVNGIRGEHIALIAPNSYEWVVVFFAIISTGNIVVPLNPMLPEEMLKQQCIQADVSLIYSNQNVAKNILEEGAYLDYESLKTMPAIQLENTYEVKERDTVILLTTSGTTGKSKIVEITSRNLEYSVYSAEELYSFEGCEKIQIALPLFHVGGIENVMEVLNWSQAMCLGRDMRSLFADMAALNPTGVTMVPAMLESLKKILMSTKTEEEKEKYVGNRLQRILIGGASSKESVCQFFMENGFILESAYGMSETTGFVTWSKLDSEHMGTIGKLQGENECKIVDGELLFKGPSIMKGYYKDSEETEKIIEDGWIHSGDMGYCDEYGYYYITGRKKNVIILSNGENVNPEEIEAILYNCESIVEIMIYSDRKGICADVFSTNDALVKQYIKEYNVKTPLYRQIYKVNYMKQPLEKTGSGKIKRKKENGHEA